MGVEKPDHEPRYNRGMYTQCPDCHAVYTVDAATLAQAHGNVGCGQCGATFNALATLVEAWPDGTQETLPLHPSSPGPPILMLAVASHLPSPAATSPPAVEAEEEQEEEQEAQLQPLASIADAWPDTVTAAPAEASVAVVPSFVRRARAAHRLRHRALWVAACAVLTLALGIQLVWANRVALTADPGTRPWLARACDWFGCTLPPVRDLADLELVSRDVRPHPNVPGALLISATLRNNAPFTQPYPVVSITLSDLDENRIAMRRFRPSEYIADPKVRAAGLAPGATAALMFEVKDPGQNAVAFQFGFQ